MHTSNDPFGATLVAANPAINVDPWFAGITADGANPIAFQWYQFVTDN